MDNLSALVVSEITVLAGMVSPTPTPAGAVGLAGQPQVNVTVKTQNPRPAVHGAGTSKGKQEWTPPPVHPCRRVATGAPLDFISTLAVVLLLESLHQEIRKNMAGAVKTRSAGRAIGMLASRSAGMPRSASSDYSASSDGELVRRVREDFQIPDHKVRNSLLNTVTDWLSYRLKNQNQTLTGPMRLRVTQDRKQLRASVDRMRCNGIKPAKLFFFLREVFRA